MEGIPQGQTYLCEFGLSVGPQIFVPEASSHLVVLGDTTRHEDLLVLLRTLWQRVGQTPPTGWDQELPRSFGGGLE